MAATLPVEIWSHIFYSFTSLGTLLSCRLASRTLCHLATPAAFYHVRLPAWNDGSRFTNIARSGHLRSLVREVTVDTCINPDFLRNRPDPEYQPSADFFSALPWLRFLTGLKRLNLRFHDNNDFGEDDEAVVTAYFDFQYFVLWTIFSSLTDHWSASQAHGITTNSEIQLWERTRTPTGVQMIDDEQYWVVLAKKLASAGQPAGPVELEALTISNLAGCTDERLTDSDSFKQALSTVTDLRLHVKFANQDLGDPHDDPVLMREQNAFMASLSRAWLAPEVARKLRVLSLFCSVYWGWNPKLDFRHINPGTDADSGFPKLEVLALGKFVFSHEWQKDWFASLGRRNGHGGLRELYLEDCALLHTVYGYDELDPEYPAPDYKHIQSTDMVTPPRNQPPSTRWHHLFTSWREGMRGLRVFRMGSGLRDKTHGDLILQSRMELETPFEMETLFRSCERWRCLDFLTYDCPSAPEDGHDTGDIRRFANGVGIREYNGARDLRYLGYHPGLVVDGAEIYSGYRTEDPVSDEPAGMDQQAWDDLQETVRQRNLRQ